MDRTRSDAETRAGDGVASSHIHMRTGPADADESPPETRPPLAGIVGRARAALGGRIPETSLLEGVRSKPLAAIGIAFSAGFLFAVTRRSGRRPAFLDNARSRIRALLLTGLTAAIAQEIRSIVGDEDLSELLDAWTGHDDDEDELDDEFDIDEPDEL